MGTKLAIGAACDDAVLSGLAGNTRNAPSFAEAGDPRASSAHEGQAASAIRIRMPIPHDAINDHEKQPWGLGQ